MSPIPQAYSGTFQTGRPGKIDPQITRVGLPGGLASTSERYNSLTFCLRSAGAVSLRIFLWSPPSSQKFWDDGGKSFAHFSIDRLVSCGLTN